MKKLKKLKNRNFWFFEKKIKIFRKIENFDFSKFSLIFRKIFFRKMFGRISPILHGRSPRLSELISKVEWFFCSRFFCASRSIQVVLGKNCLGLRGARSAAVVEQVFFSWGIFPRERSTYLESVIYSRVPGWRRVRIGSRVIFGVISWIFMFFPTFSDSIASATARDG